MHVCIHVFMRVYIRSRTHTRAHTRKGPIICIYMCVLCACVCPRVCMCIMLCKNAFGNFLDECGFEHVTSATVTRPVWPSTNVIYRIIDETINLWNWLNYLWFLECIKWTYSSSDCSKLGHYTCSYKSNRGPVSTGEFSSLQLHCFRIIRTKIWCLALKIS